MTFRFVDRWQAVVVDAFKAAIAHPDGDAMAEMMRLLDARDVSLEEFLNGTGQGHVTNSLLGMYVTNSVNSPAILNGASSLINFDTEVFARGLNAPILPPYEYIVPVGGGGEFHVAAGVYWAAARTGVTVSVTVNTTTAAASAVPSLTADRAFVSGLVSLSAGDSVGLNVSNASGVSITPTVLALGLDRPKLPFLRAVRVAA